MLNTVTAIKIEAINASRTNNGPMAHLTIPTGRPTILTLPGKLTQIGAILTLINTSLCIQKETINTR